MLLHWFFPLPTGQVLLLVNYLELLCFLSQSIQKIRFTNFDLFSLFDKNSLKSQGVLDLTELMMMRFDLSRPSLSRILIDTGLYVSATISARL